MTLDPQLQRKIKNADDKQARQSSRPTTGRAIFAHLHQVITGQSGTSDQAAEYAAAVAAQGILVREKTPVVLDGKAWPAGAKLEATLKKGERGVTIVDNIDSLTDDQLAKFRTKLAELMSAGHGVFVIAGTQQGVARLLNGHPVLTNKLNVPLDLSPPAPPVGQQAPATASPQPGSPAPQVSPVQKSLDIVAQWRETRDCDICTTQHEITAPITAVFKKKNVPVT